MSHKKTLFILWALLVAIFFFVFHIIFNENEHANLDSYIKRIKNEVEKQSSIQQEIKNEIFQIIGNSQHVFPVLILACDRITITRTLDQILRLRPNSYRYPIYVSIGCQGSKLFDTLHIYNDKINIMKHIPDNYDPEKNIPLHLWGYHKIAKHYKFALTKIFETFNYTSVIIVEDDFDLAPDFFEYFEATYPLLDLDPSIWCISCWNDNGLANLTVNDPTLLHRSDFFPGLGWLMSRQLWMTELRQTWPEAYWDDWMRRPDVRRGRVCVRPEISRVFTFGVAGVSSGQYYRSHLSKIILNRKKTPFIRIGMEDSHAKHKIIDLIQENYDAFLFNSVNASIPVTLDQLLALEPLTTSQTTRTMFDELKLPSYRIDYQTENDFVRLAHTFGLMSDIRGGTARTSYRGIVSFVLNGHRVYLVRTSTSNKLPNL